MTFEVWVKRAVERANERAPVLSIVYAAVLALEALADERTPIAREPQSYSHWGLHA